MQISLRDPNSEDWLERRTLDFHQVLQVLLLPVGIRPYLEKSYPTPRPVVRLGVPQGFDEVLWFSSVLCVHRPWALGGDVGRTNMSMGGGSLGACIKVVSYFCSLLPLRGFLGHVLALSNLILSVIYPKLCNFSYSNFTLVLVGCTVVSNFLQAVINIYRILSCFGF